MAARKRPHVKEESVKLRIAESLTDRPRPPNGLKLDRYERAYWNSIVDSRLDWTGPDLILAYHLARMYREIEKIHAQLIQDGPFLTNKKGQLYPHPAEVMLNRMMRQAVMLAAKIQVHALATVGAAEEVFRKNNAKIQAAKVRDKTVKGEEDSLIAGLV